MSVRGGVRKSKPVCEPDRAAPENEIFIAFLPLAHILEFLAESVMLTLGVKIGYSSPNTLMDTGTMIKKGAKVSFKHTY